MFVKKTKIDSSKFELLKDVSDMDSQQIMKHYFGDVDVKTRTRFLASLFKKSSDKFELNIHAHSLLVSIKQQEVDDLPILVNSIILNTLAFEANEEIEKTLYKDYKDKNISKHGKQFIAGQYKIFRNSHEQLLNVNKEQTEKIIKELEGVLDAFAKTKYSPEEIIKKLLE